MVAQWATVPALTLLWLRLLQWHGLDPWPRNFCMPQTQPNQTKPNQTKSYSLVELMRENHTKRVSSVMSIQVLSPLKKQKLQFIIA